jgi:hypothetical protein
MLFHTQVEATYVQQGYHVERNEQFGFLVVSDRANTAAAAAAASAGAASSSDSPPTPGWLRNSGDSSSSSSSSDDSTDSSSTDGVLAHRFAISGWRQTSNDTAAGTTLHLDRPSYGSSSSEPSTDDSPSAATAAAASSAAAAAAARTAAMQQQLGSLEGVERVELNVQWWLLHRTANVRGQRRMLRQQQQQQQRRSLRETAAGPTCGDRMSYNPDYQVGRTAEGTPYGVSMVSARQQQQQQQQQEPPL